MNLAAPRTRAASSGTATLAGAADSRTRALDRVSAERASSEAHHDEDGFDVLHRRDGTGEDDDRRQDQRRKSSRLAWITVFFVAVLLVLVGGYVFLSTMADDRSVEEVPTVVVPDLTGLPEADATDTIVDLGLTPSRDEAFNASVDAGDVISSDPGSGASVKPESRVNITVSLGPANVLLPDDLVGLTESSARDALEDLGLRGGEVTEETSADVTLGRVITTNPQAGQSVPVGSSVDLVLSNGKVTVPLLTDLTLEQAEALLTDPAVRLPFVVREVENSVVAPGIVTAQSAPARSEVAQGTEIELTVARAPAEEPTEEPTPEPSPSGEASEKPGEESNPRPTEGSD
jgi:beta-lactam-binding protein with PASTA domain